MEIFRQSPETNEIVFHEDGSWATLKQQKETHVIASPVVVTSTAAVSATSASTTGTFFLMHSFRTMSSYQFDILTKSIFLYK